MRKARSRRTLRSPPHAETSRLSAMVDTVFLLLAFFVFTHVVPRTPVHFAPPRAFAPGPDQVRTPPPLLRIEVRDRGYRLNDAALADAATLRADLTRLARTSRNQPVRVVGSDRSAHGRLIDALDACAEAGFTRVQMASAPRSPGPRSNFAPRRFRNRYPGPEKVSFSEGTPVRGRSSL